MAPGPGPLRPLWAVCAPCGYVGVPRPRLACCGPVWLARCPGCCPRLGGLLPCALDEPAQALLLH